MGLSEEKSRKKRRRANLKQIILSTIAVAGVLSVAAVAPNALGAMAKIGLMPSKREKECIKRAQGRLLRQGLLRYENGKLRLTETGKRELRLLEFNDFKTKKPRRWDGKWRLLVFDIPENRRGLRNKVRSTLVSIGFVHLQHSVWLYPYDCEDLIALLKADFKIGKDLLYVIADSLEYDLPFRKQFGLPTEATR